MIARMRMITREELINMHPEVLAQLVEQLRVAMSATGRPDIFTLPEAAAYTRHSLRQWQRIVASGACPTTRLAGSSRVLVTRAAIDELLAQGEL